MQRRYFRFLWTNIKPIIIKKLLIIIGKRNQVISTLKYLSLKFIKITRKRKFHASFQSI